MDWEDREESSNVEDRRGLSGGGIAIGGGLTGIVILILALIFGIDPRALLQQGGPQNAPGAETRSAPNPNEAPVEKFSRVVLKDTEDVWHKLFSDQLHRQYHEPILVLFSNTTQSPCGMASDATGPFYCPSDQKVYLDLQFFSELQNRFHAAGDFAQAYVIAHEVGHHVQDELGILNQVHSKEARVGKVEQNQLSVRTELQADYLAGVWAHYEQSMKNVLQPGDVDEALGAASAVGDDRLQKQSQGYAVPDSFTHGTSAQRMKWFKRGFDTGNLSQMMDLFNLRYNDL